MINAFRRDFDAEDFEFRDNETGECAQKGCGHKEHKTLYVYIDENLPPRQQLLTLAHEIIEIHFPHIKHSKIDGCGIDLIDAMLQLDFIH